MGADGRPVRGVKVSLLGEPGFAEAVLSMLAMTSSLGLVCGLTSCVEEASAVTVRPGPDGGFLFDLRADAAPLKLSRQTLVVTDPATGASVRHDVEAPPAGGSARLRPIPLWDLALTVTPTPAGPRLGFRVPPDTYRPVPAVADVRTALDAQSLRFDVAPGRTLDARMLAPYARGIRLQLRAAPHGPRLVYTSRDVAYTAPATTPLSRGAACHFADAAGNRRPSPRRCSFTDGRLNAGSLLDHHCGSEADCPGHVVVDLGAVRPVAAVVAYAMFHRPDVALSLDGRRWTPVGPEDGGGHEAFRVRPPPGTRARYVRVSVPEAVLNLLEVAVFG